MDNSQFDSKAPSGRRLFLKKGLAAGAAGPGIAVLAGTSTVFAQTKGLEEGGGRLSKGDAALLRFPDGLTFPNLNAHPFGGQTLQTTLIMPEPCQFLIASFPFARPRREELLCEL
jgi:hypothetical protein